MCPKAYLNMEELQGGLIKKGNKIAEAVQLKPDYSGLELFENGVVYCGLKALVLFHEIEMQTAAVGECMIGITCLDKSLRTEPRGAPPLSYTLSPFYFLF